MRLRAGVALGLLLSAAGCGVVGIGKTTTEAEQLRAVQGRPDGQRWLASDTARARQAGASTSEIIAVDAGAPGDRIAGMVATPTDTCALFLARASDGVDDIDLFAFGDDGTLFGADERPDKTPAVLVCPPHPKRMYVAARIAGGHGVVAIAAQRVAPSDADRVAKLLAARRASGSSSVDAWAGLDETVSTHRRGIGGNWQEVRRVATPVDAGTATRLSSLVEAERCLDVLVVPNEDVSHLDVAALDQTGRIVARASARGRERFLVICSSEKLPVTIELRPQSGRGFAAVVLAQSRENSRSAIEARIPVVQLAPVVTLEEAVDKHGAYLDGQGYSAAKKLSTGTLSVGRRQSIDVDLPRGCTRIDLLGGRPLSGIEAWLWTPAGALLAHDRGSAQATLFACGASGPARVDFEALAHTGPFAVELRAVGSVPKALLDHPLAAGRLLARMEARGVARRIDQVGAPKIVALSASQRGSLDAVVPIGRCVDVALGLGPGASGAEVRLLDAATGREVDAGHGTVSAAARACSLSGGKTLRVRVELRATAGSTDALVATRMLAPRE